MNAKQFFPSPDNRDVISLFSGAMGMDIGLMQAGLKLKMTQEFDGACIKTIKAQGHPVIEGDIRGVGPEAVLESASLRRAEPFLLCGGPPCQSFSTAGNRRGLSDIRGSLYREFIRMVDHIKPRFFIMENVKGLMSCNAEINSESSALGMILDDFHALGYKTVYGILDSVNYGVPQFRERFIMIGSRDHEKIYLPLPTHFHIHQDPKYQWVTLHSAIGDLEDDPGEHLNFGAKRMELLRLVPEGGNWRSLPEDIVQMAMGGAFKSIGGKVGFYRRLSYSQPCPTVTTSPVQKASMLCHPRKDRPLSLKEYVRVQQFPDNWNFCGTLAGKYKQVGNAVPVGLAKAIGHTVISVADGKSTVDTKRIRGTGVHSKILAAVEMGFIHGNAPLAS